MQAAYVARRFGIFRSLIGTRRIRSMKVIGVDGHGLAP